MVTIMPPGCKYNCTLKSFRNAVVIFEKYITSAKEFMKHVGVRLREAYKQSLQQRGFKKFLMLVTNGTPLQAIKDVSFDANCNNMFIQLQLFPDRDYYFLMPC